MFPRAADQIAEGKARREAMQRHPAGKAHRKPIAADNAVTASPQECTGYEVKEGDTLWELASRGESGTLEDVAARVRAIHRANRRVIGPDPDLILPGQMVSLPGDCSR